MTSRNYLAIGLGTLCVCVVVITLLPAFQKPAECDSKPANSAQTAALDDARLRKASLCASSDCAFYLDSKPDSSIQVSVKFLQRGLVFQSCFVNGEDTEELVYDRAGHFVWALTRVENPYGLQ
jgi:hypothetical protein